ncbi:polymerase [Paenibacillus sp. 32O-W]|uniref:DUF342 domain-containing protein n=1 Tax=Paenibacillus sp. 32O-W TaxID=1695218 RepID=UPI00071F66C4|nr:FapA family protein [Paenibacillus sp. 32O-W]ALS27574.1 polymerase [Paenibacillus sp. 32O-W]
MSVPSSLDRYIRIRISHDKLSAYLEFAQVDDTISFTAEELESYVQSQGVVYGIRTELLKEIAAAPIKFFSGAALIASGDEPTDGEDGSIRMVAEAGAERKPAQAQDGKVDFRDVLRLSNVKRGQLIAERIPAKPGKDGRAVTGDPLPGRKGREARFKIGKNVVTNPEQTALYATIDGMVSKTDGDKINVFPVYEVNGDVDYNIGNIDFVGNVVVRGNVLTGFSVKAAGDIRIVGGVEGAMLEAGGSIEITGGIMAGHKGLVKANKTVRSSFIQDGNVTAGEDVIVSQSIMHSQVKAGRNVECIGAKGLIVGGVIQAGERVSVRTLGNTMSTATTVEVGVKPELRAELIGLRAKLKECTDSLDKTGKALALLDQFAASGQLTPDRMAMRVKLLSTKQQAQREQDELREQILAIEKMLEDAENARVNVVHTVYGGTKIVIGRYTRFVKDPASRVTFCYADGDVSTVPYRS